MSNITVLDQETQVRMKKLESKSS